MPGEIVILVNEKAGTKSTSADEVRAALRTLALDVDVIAPKPGANPEQIAREEASRGRRVIVAAGGDGTVSAVAAGVIGTDASLGILPLGTLNHFARDLGIPPALPDALAVLADGEIASIDVAEVNGHLFLNNSSLGLYPLMVRHRERQQKELKRPKWRAALFAAMASLRIYPMLHVLIHVEGREMERKTPLLFIGNNEYEFEGLRAGARKCIDRGCLCMLVTHPTGRVSLLWLAVRALLGRLEQAQAYDALTATNIEVHVRRREVQVGMDGEVRTLRPPLRYRLHEGALRVLVPKRSAPSAPGPRDHADTSASV